MGMARGLEIREPYLDHELVALLARLPVSVKTAGRGTKPLLSAAAGHRLPRAVLRRRKMGFVLPFERWLRGPLRPRVEAAMLDSSFGGPAAAALDHRAMSGLWQRFLAGQAGWVRPWAIFVLKAWADEHLTRACAPAAPASVALS